MGVHVPEAGQQPAATGVEDRQRCIGNASADGGDRAVAQRHRGRFADLAAHDVYHPGVDDQAAVAGLGQRRCR
ncbi:hypothetical protein G6F57_012683 [Rhizopus arrhizus]|uniref:Uncharacterized protein n=1 Tax=Rhizopus oryzae TaxID=64495 RepID=A0A9P7BJ87_RHIOR|nr:hypothetical protein G6F40_017852 [Rhizopus arrhizus]KAG1193547.1 hypothetical protein G6F35_013494 [Rhizopus arrhizus]KAG1277832.1 hypothetical protein G6F64_014701 [Rhizopus arrhizus]KAG1468229.1 hypothetical protein G6F57_012683 [Rhizopus arrhizus]